MRLLPDLEFREILHREFAEVGEAYSEMSCSVYSFQRTCAPFFAARRPRLAMMSFASNTGCEEFGSLRGTSHSSLRYRTLRASGRIRPERRVENSGRRVSARDQ